MVLAREHLAFDAVKQWIDYSVPPPLLFTEYDVVLSGSIEIPSTPTPVASRKRRVKNPQKVCGAPTQNSPARKLKRRWKEWLAARLPGHASQIPILFIAVEPHRELLPFFSLRKKGKKKRKEKLLCSPISTGRRRRDTTPLAEGLGRGKVVNAAAQAGA